MITKFSAQDVPNAPGVYVFRNQAGEVIYVGKAKSLRKRLGHYFQPSRNRTADPKLRALIHSIASYETFRVSSETEALLFESRLIKQYHPRYNTDLRDDKRFLHICVDPSEVYPRLQLVRIRKNDKRIYFGPFPRAGALRQTVDFLSKRFRLRTCSLRSPGLQAHKHCMEQRLKHCMCPCIGSVSADEYGDRLAEALAVLEGRGGTVLDDVTADMQTAAAALDFEKAAVLRDLIDNLRSVCDPRRRDFRHATLRSGEDACAEAVDALQAELGLRARPEVIECFDISMIAGQLAVGSMVCFRGGKPCKKYYRRFRIRRPNATDDTAMMREVLERRYAKDRAGRESMPDLIVVDGGRGQLGAAVAALRAVEAEPVPVIGLAKREEEIIVPGQRQPIRLARHHAALKLLQAIRDEAHRFALTYNRALRRRRIADSVLSEIRGVGPARRQRLLTVFGSVRKLAEATPDEIAAAVPGVGVTLADEILIRIRERLRAKGSRDAP